jgi:cytochrome P450
MMCEWVKECGTVYTAQIINMRWVVICEPEDIRSILVTDNIQKGGFLEISTLFGPNNILTMYHGPGNPHRAQRNIMNQAFKVSRNVVWLL